MHIKIGEFMIIAKLDNPPHNDLFCIDLDLAKDMRYLAIWFLKYGSIWVLFPIEK